MSKLRASITYQHRSNKESENQVSEDEASEDEESEDIQEAEDSTIDEHVESFNYLIDEWENLLAQEVEAKQNENEDTDYDLEVDIDEYLLTQTHPAVDIGAKWYICEIFADNLEAPYDIN